MRELVTVTFVSIDGVMQSPAGAEEDPSEGFSKGGWAVPYWEGTMPDVLRTSMSGRFEMLFGRKTYDSFAAHWQNEPRSDLSDVLNTSKKYVVTSSSDTLSWYNSLAIVGDIEREVAALKAKDGPRLQVHGSHHLIQTLHAAGLIDEYRLWIFPVVLGAGKRLFGPQSIARTLSLVKSESLENGVSSQFYRSVSSST